MAAAPGVVITVRVVPRASRSAIAGMRDDAWLVRLAAPPVDGAANDELIEVIARALGVPRRSVTIESGERSRRKLVRIVGLPADQIQARLRLAK